MMFTYADPQEHCSRNCKNCDSENVNNLRQNQQLKSCYPHMPIGMLGIYRLLFFVCVCVSAGFLVTDISGVG